MKCLILGGGGFLGSHLCEALLSIGHHVRIFDRPNLRRIGNFFHSDDVEWIEGDFTNKEDIEQTVHGCDVIYHLVSTTIPKSSIKNPIYDIETNVVSTVHLLELAQKKNIRKIIFISSGGTVYGVPLKIPITESHLTKPICSYGICKLTIEKYLHLYNTLHGMDNCILRLSNPYGERQRSTGFQGAVAVFLYKAIKNEPVEIWGDGSVVRDYFHVSDAVSAMVKILSFQGEDNIFNIGSGNGLSLNQVLDEIEVIIGRPVSRIYLKGRSFDVPVNILDIERAKTILGWEPKIPFRQGLERTLQWMEKWADRDGY